MILSSVSAQVAGAPETAVESMALMRYVKGLTLYMKIQKPGSAPGVARTLDLLAKGREGWLG